MCHMIYSCSKLINETNHIAVNMKITIYKMFTNEFWMRKVGMKLVPKICLEQKGNGMEMYHDFLWWIKNNYGFWENVITDNES